MFIGQYSHTIDAKGRMAVPVKFRKELAKSVITKGLDGCLVLYPAGEWKKLADKLAALPISKANARGFSRLMLAGAMDCDVDRQGRVMLPDYLRQFAGITKKVIVAGLYNRVELWEEKAWEKYRANMEKDSGKIAEQLGELGV
ncbi:division/cell wall cluster transcriptional repressor MraZ [Candidatus Falkowbacteria bacterium]|nr:division/cell wall cluster transcriptional repressor MraZ [Candidatus Falkowbacteria bacterium]